MRHLHHFPLVKENLFGAIHSFSTNAGVSLPGLLEMVSAADNLNVGILRIWPEVTSDP
ncbi:hypothetical protein METHPM2_350001 [Pseudomonas sp. PM2]|uniref:hypothetical protein n=1 Tax=Pseudomonas sp. PM2 TaxID=215172 RepID=UPI003FA19F09